LPDSGFLSQPSDSRSNEWFHTLAALVGSSDTAMIGVSLDGTIVSWNRGAELMYGYTPFEAIGRAMDMLLPDDRSGEYDDLLARIRQGERIEPFETVRLTKSGAALDVSLLLTPARDEHGNIVRALTIARDITEQVQARQNLEQMSVRAENRALVLETANQVALNILSNRSGIEALRHISEASRNLAKANYAALGVANPDGSGLIEFVTTGLDPDQEAAIGPRPRGHGILGLLLGRNEPLRIDNLGQHASSVGFPPNHPPMNSFLGVPIRRGETVLGSLYLTDKIGGGNFTESDEAAVQALGSHAAVAIHHMQMIERQRALVRGLMFAQEEERRNVAYELHDGLTQYVMAAHAHLQSFKRAHETGANDRAQREMDNGLSYLKEAVVESRRLVNGLRSLALEDLGLAGAVEQLVNEEKARAEWTDAHLIHNIAGQRFDRALETAAYRVIQEALTNARKHGDTSKVQVMLLLDNETASGTELLVEVRDWGKGFVPEEKVGQYAHFGLQGMIERIQLMGGRHELRSAPGLGTTLRAVFPVLRTEESGDELSGAESPEE
jgi:PAS domain S-box-containing protein